MNIRPEEGLIRDFIYSKLAKKRINENFSENLNLIDSGIVDSLGIMQLIYYIENTFSIKIDDNELFPENFESIENISKLVESKKYVH